MPKTIVCNLPDDVHRALCVRAAKNGRSTDAEAREILSIAVKPASHVRMGDALAALGRTFAMSNDDVNSLSHMRKSQPAVPLNME